jgi:hypothetical protein
MMNAAPASMNHVASRRGRSWPFVSVAVVNDVPHRARAMDIQPVVLEGQHVRLEPLTLRHAEAFCEAGREWNLTPEAVREGIESALRQQAGGHRELWIPAEDLEDFNRHIRGPIEVVAKFHGLRTD